MIKTKRWCDKKENDDGYRLLVCRYRPRALEKKKETWHGWCPELGPSKELHSDFYGKTRPKATWAEWQHRYIAEMVKQSEMIDALAELVAEGKTVTLLCSQSCNDETHCHRSLLRQLIEARVPAAQARLAAIVAVLPVQVPVEV
jgi:uncharacterized protein YeaO (DUF488 family)